MSRKKDSQKSLNRRSFLCKLAASVSFYSVPLIFSKLFLPISAIAQEGQPAAPGSMGARSKEKSVSETEIVKRVEELSKKLDENIEKYDRHLTPDQKKRQREGVEKALRVIVESKGYIIVAPYNLEIIN